MLERIKDFFYDISDIVVSLLIIALIFVSVSWKINDTLSVNIEKSDASTQEIPPIVVEPEEAPENETEPEPLPEPTPTEEPETEPEAPIEETPPTPEPVTPPVVTPAVLETFVVADGSTGYDIGVELQNAGFVVNVNDFVKRSIELGLDSKLRSGTFKLSKTDELDLIIKILTGQKRP